MHSRSFKVSHYSVFGIVALMILGPLVFLILGSFSAARMPSDFSLTGMSLKNYAAVYLDQNIYDLMGNTVIYVVGSVLLGISLAVSLAWLVEEYQLRFCHQRSAYADHLLLAAAKGTRFLCSSLLKYGKEGVHEFQGISELFSRPLGVGAEE